MNNSDTNKSEGPDSGHPERSLTHKQRRTFSFQQKDECWANAIKMIGRDPDRWRLDALGNPVCRALRGCFGPLCHEYDHMTPFSKGGKTETMNCQILQTTLNRVKSNRTDITWSELRKISPSEHFSEEEFDAIERAIYGDIRKKPSENSN